MNNKNKKVETSTEAAIVGNTLLAAVAHQKIELIKEYLDPTGVTIIWRLEVLLMLMERLSK